MTRRVLIMGAAGRDFHNFNTSIRDDPTSRSWRSPPPRSRSSTTAGIPPSWPGPHYPNGIQIHDESELDRADPHARGGRRRVRLLRRLPRVRDAQGQPGDGRRRELPAPGAERDDARRERPRRLGLRRPHRVGQEPDDARDRRRAQGCRQARGRGAPPDAVRRPGRPARAAVRDARGPRPLRHHDRGARGIRAAHLLGHDRLRRRRLRRDPRAGPGGVRRPAVGRREQRPAVLPADGERGGRRSAARRPRDDVLPRRDEHPDGRRDRHQQGGLRHAEQIAELDATIASINPTATVVRANSRVTVEEPTRSRASGCW